MRDRSMPSPPHARRYEGRLYVRKYQPGHPTRRGQPSPFPPRGIPTPSRVAQDRRVLPDGHARDREREPCPLHVLVLLPPSLQQSRETRVVLSPFRMRLRRGIPKKPNLKRVYLPTIHLGGFAATTF